MVGCFISKREIMIWFSLGWVHALIFIPRKIKYEPIYAFMGPKKWVTTNNDSLCLQIPTRKCTQVNKKHWKRTTDIQECQLPPFNFFYFFKFCFCIKGVTIGRPWKWKKAKNHMQSISQTIIKTAMDVIIVSISLTTNTIAQTGQTKFPFWNRHQYHSPFRAAHE